MASRGNADAAPVAAADSGEPHRGALVELGVGGDAEAHRASWTLSMVRATRAVNVDATVRGVVRVLVYLADGRRVEEPRHEVAAVVVLVEFEQVVVDAHSVLVGARARRCSGSRGSVRRGAGPPAAAPGCPLLPAPAATPRTRRRRRSARGRSSPAGRRRDRPPSPPRNGLVIRARSACRHWPFSVLPLGSPVRVEMAVLGVRRRIRTPSMGGTGPREAGARSHCSGAAGAPDGRRRRILEEIRGQAVPTVTANGAPKPRDGHGGGVLG